MKLRTITCHHVYNHGAYLQAYALIEYLKLLGHDAKIIDYRPPYLSGHFNLWAVPSSYKRFGLSIPYILAKLPGRLRALSRKKAFDEFYAQYMDVDSPVYHSVEELRSNPPQADLYIAGSDQIWNTTFENGRDAAFYLDFGSNRTRKISYAASFALNEIEVKYQTFVEKQLRNFDAISVREEPGLRILSNWGMKAELVVDPVFLLEVEKWDQLDSGEGHNDDYILVYDFYSDTSIQHIARSLAKEYGCKIYSVGPYKLNYADRNYINYGPSTFVTLIKYARCIVSNSFHGTAFSIIYRKDFFVVNRMDGLNTRMQDLLAHYNISQRLVNVETSLDKLTKHIDYSQVEQQLQEDISHSKLYLQNHTSLNAV